MLVLSYFLARTLHARRHTLARHDVGPCLLATKKPDGEAGASKLLYSMLRDIIENLCWSEIKVVDDVYNGYWMNPAYRIPDNDCNCVAPGTAPSKTIPINQFTIRSFITNFTDNSIVTVGKPVQARGIAFDAGYGIKKVLFSQDNGQNWTEARLGQDLGRFSFREWRIEFTPKQKGILDLRVRAFNHAGQFQPMTASWMPAGYMRNIVETVKVTAV